MLTEKDALTFVELMGEEERAPVEVEADVGRAMGELAGRALRGGIDGGTFLQLAEVKFRTALAQYRYDHARPDSADPPRPIWSE